MRSSVSVAVVLAVCVAIGLAAAPQQTPPPPPPQPAPVFRAGVDIFHLDVSVLDKKRQPVRGLKAEDFTVLEDGKPQKVVVLDEVDIPDPEEPPAAWMRDVTPDVVTNQLGERRLFIIVMDDSMVPQWPVAVKHFKEIGRQVVERLGPTDLAAVVFTRDNRHPQDFTNDRAKLLAAVERATFGGGLPEVDSMNSLNTIGNAAKFLIEIPERRKAMVYITFGMSIDIGSPQLLTMGASMAGQEELRLRQQKRDEIFKQAQRSNVSIYTYDVCGVRIHPLAAPPGDPCIISPGIDDFFHMIANNTGGRAVTMTDDFRPGIEQMFRENSSYYVVGYQSTAPIKDEQYRRIEIKVNRPDVEVISRKQHYTEKTPKPKPGSAPPSALTKALAGLLPNPEMPLRASVAPFAVPGKRGQTAVAVILGVDQPAPAGAPAATPGTPATIETVDLLVSAFDPEGRPRDTRKGTAKVTLRPGANGASQYDLLMRIDLLPGSYQLRLASNAANRHISGSVYADVEIPNFTKAPVSMSGLVLSASPGIVAAPKDALATLLPIVPTSLREFVRADRVTAFARIYQGGGVKDDLRAARIRIRITDDADRAVADNEQLFGSEKFTTDRSADVRFAVPLVDLRKGAYLLTLEARLDDKTSARRDVRFTVK